MNKRWTEIIYQIATSQRTTQSPNRSCDKWLGGRIWATSKTAEHTSQCHYCTRFVGYVLPPSRWGCTIQSHLCSFWLYLWLQLDSPKKHAPSFQIGLRCHQCKRWGFGCSVHGRLWCIRTRRVILDGDTTRGFVFGLSGNHKAIHQKTHAGEILTTVFFARVIIIFCHQGEDTGGRERGRMGSLYLMSLIFGGGKDVPDE